MRPTGRHTASIQGVGLRNAVAPTDGVGEQKPLGAVECGAGQRGGMTMDKAWAAVAKSRRWHDSPSRTEDAANAYP